MDLRNDDEFSLGRREFRVDPQQPAAVPISSGIQSAHGQPSATNIQNPNPCPVGIFSGRYGLPAGLGFTRFSRHLHLASKPPLELGRADVTQR